MCIILPYNMLAKCYGKRTEGKRTELYYCSNVKWPKFCIFSLPVNCAKFSIKELCFSARKCALYGRRQFKQSVRKKQWAEEGKESRRGAKVKAKKGRKMTSLRSITHATSSRNHLKAETFPRILRGRRHFAKNVSARNDIILFNKIIKI